MPRNELIDILSKVQPVRPPESGIPDPGGPFTRPAVPYEQQVKAREEVKKPKPKGPRRAQEEINREEYERRAYQEQQLRARQMFERYIQGGGLPAIGAQYGFSAARNPLLQTPLMLW